MPMRILLIGAVVFLAAWFTILKPKSAEEVPPLTTETTTTAPVSGAGKAVDAAKKWPPARRPQSVACTDSAPATTTAPGARA